MFRWWAAKQQNATKANSSAFEQQQPDRLRFFTKKIKMLIGIILRGSEGWSDDLPFRY